MQLPPCDPDDVERWRRNFFLSLLWKNFEREAKSFFEKMIGTKKLAAALHTTEAKIAVWVKLGMPSSATGKRFEFEDCLRWAILNGHVRPSIVCPGRNIATSISELARETGIQAKRIRQLMNVDGFPGTPSDGLTPRHQSFFPVDEIKEFATAQLSTEDSGSKKNGIAQQNPIDEVKYQRELMKLEKERGHLISRDLVQRFYERTLTYAMTTLEQLVGRIDACLPEEANEDMRQSIRIAVTRIIRDARVSLSQLIAEDPENDDEEFELSEELNSE